MAHDRPDADAAVEESSRLSSVSAAAPMDSGARPPSDTGQLPKELEDVLHSDVSFLVSAARFEAKVGTDWIEHTPRPTETKHRVC